MFCYLGDRTFFLVVGPLQRQEVFDLLSSSQLWFVLSAGALDAEMNVLVVDECV